jgi:hypothetical protein
MNLADRLRATDLEPRAARFADDAEGFHSRVAEFRIQPKVSEFWRIQLLLNELRNTSQLECAIIALSIIPCDIDQDFKAFPIEMGSATRPFALPPSLG